MSETPTTTSYLPRIIDAYLDELLEQLPSVMVVGPRATGKTTTLSRRASSIVRLDEAAQAAAFEADPDAALRTLEEPVLLDEWQAVPGVFGAVRRAVNEDPRPSRFHLSGSAWTEQEHDVYAGTGRVQRLEMLPMTVRELEGNAAGPTLFDRLAQNEPLADPADPPDLRGYLELALRGGFPLAALRLSRRAREAWLESYVTDLLTRDVETLEEGRPGRPRDEDRLRRYFEAYALNSAGVVEDKRIYEAAQIRRETGEAYEGLLMRLFAVERIPAWSSNRLKRLVKQPKRYVIDPAVLAAALRVDADGLIADGDLMGRMIDTLVAAQLRPEAQVSHTRPRLFHLRTKQGRQEIDLLAELSGGGLIGIEVKAGATPSKTDAKHLAWLRDEAGDRFLAGIVFHTGPRVFSLDEQIVAAPIASIWS